MMQPGRVTVGGAVGFALSLLAAQWRSLWGVLALNALAMTVAAAGGLTGNLALLAAGFVASLLFGVMLQGALFRLAFADRHADDPAFRPGQLGLQWSAVEWRMVLAALLFALAFAFIALLLLIAATAVLFGLFTAQGIDPAATFKLPVDPAALDPRVRLPLALAQFAVMLPLAYLTLRLCLALPATADRGKVQVFSTWKWTRGAVLRVLAAELIITLPFFLLREAVVGAAAEAGIGPGTAMAVALLVGLSFGAVLAPLSAGLAAYFYRNLAPPPERSA